MKGKKALWIGLLFLALGIPVWYLGTALSPQQIQQALAELGLWAPLAYVGLFTVLPAFFFPVAVLALAGGLLFGLWQGAVWTFVGAMLNCSVMFWLARNVGRQRISQLIARKLPPHWQRRIGRLEGREGFSLLVILRLIPAVPYNLINYAFGLTDMAYGTYLLASAIGMIPGTFVFINMGDKVLDVTDPSFWLAVGLLVLLLVGTALLGKVLLPGQNKERNGEKEDETE